MKKRIFKLHRKLAAIVALPVILWALSGILHPIMANWLRPSIAKTFIIPTPLRPSAETLAPAVVFRDLPELHQLHLVMIDGQPTYCAITPDQTAYYRHATLGTEVPDAEKTYVEQLARQFLDDQTSALVSIEKVESFGANYSYINRLLPAYRVQLDREDGMEVVVDPRTGKLATYDSPSKRVFSTLFSWFHTWSFLGARDSLFRIITVLTLASLTLIVGLTGIANLFLFKVKRKGESGRKRKISTTKKCHRILGAVSSLFFLMFTTSAIYHVAAKLDYDDSTSWRSGQTITTSQLTASPAEVIALAQKPVSKLSLASIHDQPHYRLAIMDRQEKGLTSYFHTSNKSLLENGEENYAKALATEFSAQPADSISKTELITGFRNDYGFIFKRLPVTRVHYEGQPYWSYTVDTANAHLAQRTNTAGVVEAISFINLHKWHFLDPVSKDLRDYATAVAASFIALLTILGAMLMRKSKRKVSKHERTD